MYKLDDIVRELIIEKDLSTEHDYPRFLQLGINGLRQLSMDISGLPKSVVLEINDNLTVDLPSDYIKYTKIAVVGGDGQLHSLGLNSNMALMRETDECGVPIPTQQQSSGSFENLNLGSMAAGYMYGDGPSGHFRNGEVTGRFFGIGGGNNALGYYKIDTENGYIQLDSTVTSTAIYLDYIAKPTAIDGNYQVHDYIAETLKAYIHWASIRMKKNVNLGDKEQARREYFNERRLSNLRFQSFTIDEAYQALRTSFKQSPKL